MKLLASILAVGAVSALRLRREDHMFDMLDGLAHQGEEMYDYGSGSTDVDEPDHNDNEVHTPVDYVSFAFHTRWSN